MGRPNRTSDSTNVLPFARANTVDLRCEDNIEYMRSLEKNSIHLIVTSPPYNMGKAYEKRTSLGAYIEEQSATIAEAVRLLHPNGSICWQVGNHIDNGEVFPLDAVLYTVTKRSLSEPGKQNG